MLVRADMVNGHDLCHGGLIASLADSAFALACNSHGPVTVAAGFSIDLLAPARLGQTLYADAREVSRRGRSGLYDVTVRADDPEAGAVIAEFRGRSRTIEQSNYRLTIQRKATKKWRTVRRTQTLGPRDRITIDLRRGTYRVVVPAQHGLQGVRATARLGH